MSRLPPLGVVLVLISFASAATGEPITEDRARKVADDVDAPSRTCASTSTAPRRASGQLGPSVERAGSPHRGRRSSGVVGRARQAAVLLLDAVEDPNFRTHPRRDEAMFRLAEALRASGNYRLAFQYYEEHVPRTGGARRDAIVEGMLRIAAETRRQADIDRIISYLGGPGAAKGPDVEYAYGKALYRTVPRDAMTLEAALEAFSSGRAGDEPAAEARYFSGAVLVQLGRYAEAIDAFRQTLQEASGSDARIADLAQLSLGRIHQELGNVEASAESYQALEPSSPYYSEMLFEVAWTHVKAAELAEEGEQRQHYERALRATELLMATAPDATLFPQARILQGNLQIRLGAQETAYETLRASWIGTERPATSSAPSSRDGPTSARSSSSS
ncbi:MAG: tetratricopeptide repeat protein [Myxococcales bacterium]|nr:tetratricopeptide repeat protein [Myxococcales bacterium]